MYSLHYTLTVLVPLVTVVQGWPALAQDPLIPVRVRPSPNNPIQTLCDGEQCKKIRTSKILRYYDGLFHTEQEINVKLREWDKLHLQKYEKTFLSAVCRLQSFKSIKICRNLQKPNSDYDMCCPTVRYFHKNETLVNINNELKVLVKLSDPDRFQFIPHAKCLRTGACSGGFGRCETDTIEIPILVVDFGSSLYCTFEKFAIPAYCSCKSI